MGLVAGGGGLLLLLKKGPWPPTNGWFALLSGLAACPLHPGSFESMWVGEISGCVRFPRRWLFLRRRPHCPGLRVALGLAGSHAIARIAYHKSLNHECLDIASVQRYVGRRVVSEAASASNRSEEAVLRASLTQGERPLFWYFFPAEKFVFVYQIERPPEMGLLKDFAEQTPLFPLPYGG
jgi:hypothetical protein